MQRQLPTVEAGVVFGNGEQYTVAGPVARMILWLCRNQDTVTHERACELRVMLAQGAPRFSVTEVFERVEGY
jgi:hypothetical protein